MKNRNSNIEGTYNKEFPIALAKCIDRTSVCDKKFQIMSPTILSETVSGV